MLHGIINEQGHWPNVRDDILKNAYLCMLKSPASGAKMLGFISLVIFKLMYLCY